MCLRVLDGLPGVDDVMMTLPDDVSLTGNSISLPVVPLVYLRPGLYKFVCLVWHPTRQVGMSSDSASCIAVMSPDSARS